ncbi:MAG: Gfo/Idh/MocA family protein [Clostridium sp.]|uniref:Gfo/Idh/MocA family protein n=1 Tax=Clostridium sp. TaxID=1506 RepID=UPI003D6CD1B5
MIRVAIIGTGSISQSHIEGYLALKDRCVIVALVDIYPDKAREKAKKNNLLNVEIFDDHKKVLGRDDIDLIDICTPPYVHAEIAINALNSGKNVLSEKPMAASLEECDKMIEAAKKNNKVLSIIAQNRFRNEFMNLKKTLDSGLAGDIVHAQVDSFWWRGHSYYDLWWRGTWEKEGGGCTLNHAVHHIDMISWMMGMPEEVQAIMSNTSHDNAEVEDISIALLKYKGGALGQITSSVVHHGEEQQVILQGKRARISAPFKVSASKELENGFPVKDKKTEKAITDFYNGLTTLKYIGHTAQIDNVLTALETGEDVFIGGQDGRNTIELITSIYKASITKQPVKLPLQKEDEFYTVDGLQRNAPHFYEKGKSIENFSNESITLGRDIK